MELIRAEHNTIELRISVNELLALNNALNEVCNGPDAIEDWEFHTRMGVEVAEAQKLLDRLGGVFDRLGKR